MAVKKVQIDYDIILSPSCVMVLMLLSKVCMPQPESNDVDMVMWGIAHIRSWNEHWSVS